MSLIKLAEAEAVALPGPLGNPCLQPFSFLKKKIKVDLIADPSFASAMALCIAATVVAAGSADAASHSSSTCSHLHFRKKSWGNH